MTIFSPEHSLGVRNESNDPFYTVFTSMLQFLVTNEADHTDPFKMHRFQVKQKKVMTQTSNCVYHSIWKY